MRESPALSRRLGLGDAVTIGLGSMIGAGVFTAFGPAARSAGSMRERLGPFWGHLAGWAFVVGKVASCAAMALTIGLYASPGHAHLVGALVVVALVVVNCLGVQKSAVATRLVVGVVLLVLALAVVTILVGAGSTGDRPASGPDGPPAGVLQGAAFLFFAFAGYARIATLGEEVKDPARTIPAATRVAFGIALAVYLAVATALLLGPGVEAAARSSAPLADAVSATGPGWVEQLVRAGAVVAATGALLSLLLGVSRTTLAMARDGHLPHPLSTVSPARSVPVNAEVAVGLVVATVVLLADVRAAIGFSSFAVLTYYGIANASALTLRDGRAARALPALGLLGCGALALPTSSVVAGLAVLAAGATSWLVRQRLGRSRQTTSRS